MKRLLLVEDDDTLRGELSCSLARRGYAVEALPSPEGVMERLAAGAELVITDVNLDGENGIGLAERIVQSRRDVPVIVMTGFGDMETVIATLRAGAADFLSKPVDLEHLIYAVERALARRDLEIEVTRLRAEVAAHRDQGEILGSSPPMTALFDLIERVASTDSTILLTGESGAGKELVARAIHARSRRASGPFVAINCAAVPESLLESELFGHTRGAFTDAKGSRRGLFAEASGGTLVLDEIGDMPLGMQAKLLRALETRRARPVGGEVELAFDVRVIASTHRDLEARVEEGGFRGDLFYRLNVIPVEVPALRVRGRDVLVLAQAFVEKLAARHGKPVRGISGEVAAKLLAYDWPGNVRELQNTIERAVALARYEELVVDDLPPKIRDFQPSYLVLGDQPEDLVTLEELERRYIQRVMKTVAWNKTQATRVLGIDRSTLYRKLERYNIAPQSARE